VTSPDSRPDGLAQEPPRPALPTDLPQPAVPGDDVHAAPLRLAADVVKALNHLGRPDESGPSTVVLAGYLVFLAQLTGRHELVISARVPGATQDPRPRIGVTLAGSPDFREVVRRVRQSLLEAARRPSSETLPTPVHRASFGYPAAPDDTDPVELDVTFVEDGEELSGQITCTADLFHPRTAARRAAMLEHLLGELSASPDTGVFELSLLPPAERERVLHGLNHYERPDIGYTTMAQPFEEQVRRTPDATAVVSETGSMTYTEFNASANRLAWRLRECGARPGTFVAVSMRRSIELLVALYAVAKSGAAYVPIDPDLPDARTAFMLEDSAPVAVLVDGETRSRFDGPRPVLAVDQDAAQWADRPAEDPPALPGNHLIHMLYTSGTTGRPKAVAYPVDGALADIFWLHRGYPYRPGDTAILKTSYGFDVSIWEIFWPLYVGARILVCPPDAHRDPDRLHRLIEAYGVTAMFMVPSMMKPFCDRAAPGACPSLRWIFCGGEPVTPAVRDGFHAHFDTALLVNCYGPTELGCVAETVLPPAPGRPVVVGPPPAHRRIYVLGDRLEPVPVGVAGELFVGGEVGIAQSYHRRPGLSAERFLPDPHGLPGGRMYRTGDLVRYRDDGVIEHLGRIGRQMKIRGMRIELAEIEAVIAEHEDVARCVVTVAPDRGGEIAAFAVPAEGREAAVPELLAHARRLLPTHMVPPTVVLVDAIPTFVNEKIDFESLLRLRPAAPPASAGAEAGTDRSADQDADPETRVAAIFAGVLGRESVDVTESFFALGGHSLLVFTVIESCEDQFGVEVSAKEMLAALSARELAALIASRLPQDGAR